MTANISREKRYKIYRRDGFACCLCGSGSNLQIHHVIPRGEGGSDFEENLATLCAVCHAQIHGYIPLDCPDMSREDMEQMLIEYMADFYAEDGGWYPFK